MAEWYVAWVLTGKEEQVLHDVQAVPGIEDTLLPVQELPYRVQGQWEWRRSVTIPGYVFIKCEMSAPLYHRIRDIDHVIGWLGPDSMWPTDVPENEMERVKQLCTGSDPGRFLKDVRIDKHKKRGYGTLPLCGKDQRITFPIDDKQPNKERVDQRPAAEDGDQNNGGKE